MRRLKYFGICLSILTIAYLSYFQLSWSFLPENRVNHKSISIRNESFIEQINIASKRLKNIVEDLNVPSASVAVGIEGKVIWAEAIGFADLQNKIKASTETSYRIGSTSKAITSVGLMKLVQHNKLDLNQPVSQILLKYHRKKWNFTTRQLLSHTAGFPDYEDLGISGGFYSLLNFKQFESVEEGLDIFKDKPLLFEPGTQFKYNSFDVVLASRVIEVASNQDFQTFLEQEIFKPINMDHSYSNHVKTSPKSEARFYEIDKSGNYRKWHTFGFPHPNQNLSYKWASGGLVSTPTDLVKLGNALVSDSSFVSKNVRNIFFEPQRLANGKINEQQYALGWRSYYHYSSENLLGKDTSLWMVHHGGVSKGSMNFLCIFPNEQVVIDVAINGREKDFDFTPFWYHVMDILQPFLKKQYEAKNHQN